MSLNSLLNWAITLYLSFFLLACQGPTTPTPTTPTSTTPTSTTPTSTTPTSTTPTSTTPTSTTPTSTTPTSTTPRFRLVKAAIAADVFFTYSYNADNKLDTIVNYFSAPRKIISVASYDAQGRLAAIHQLPWEKFPGYKTTFTYNEQGQLKSVGESAQLGPTVFGTPSVYSVEYNSAGQIVKISGSGSTKTYTYTDGNVTQMEYTDTAPDSNKTTTYQYDDKPNPYYGLITSTYDYYDPQVLSKNNRIVPGVVYQYDKNNLPINGIGPLGQPVTYTYEQY